MKNYAPLILSFVLFAAIGALSFPRLFSGAEARPESAVFFDAVFILLYVLWILAEFRASKREVSQGNKTSDSGTFAVYAFGQGATFLSALWFGPTDAVPGARHIFGLALFLVGVGLRLWAVGTLGIYYSHIVRRVEGHRVVDTGPYRFIRHPAYAGMILIHIGVTAGFFNWITLSLLLFALTPSIILRIFVEEKTLFAMEGYPEYARCRKRLVPAVW